MKTSLLFIVNPTFHCSITSERWQRATQGCWNIVVRGKFVGHENVDFALNAFNKLNAYVELGGCYKFGSIPGET